MSQSILSGGLSGGSAAPPDRRRRAGLLRARRLAAPLLTMLSLAGVAYWGHATDWVLPGFSFGGADSTPQPQWCSAHGVPEVECIECNQVLVSPDKNYGWCDAHGVSQCPFEHPEVAQTKQPTALSAADHERARRAIALRPRETNNSRCQTHLRRIQFASHEAAEKSGVDVAVVDRGPITEAISANGEIIYDQTRLANQASRVAGTAWSVRKQVGDRVESGEVLGLIDSAEIGRAKSEFLQALTHERLMTTNLKRLAPLAEQGAVPERQIREASAAQNEAKIRLSSARQTLVNLGFAVPEDSFADADTDYVARELQFLGIPAEISSRWNPATSTTNLFPLRASLDGLVVGREVVEGEVVDRTKPLFTISDVRKMWLMLDVRQDDIDLVRIGAPVKFRASGQSASPEINGSITWISTSADDRTRTVKVRVDLPNDGQLRANTFGTGRILLREELDSIVVPSEAVHWDGCCQIVFVRDRHYFETGKPKFYHVRKVRLGVKEGGRTEILAGLVPGEVIAAKGSNVLTAQLLRSNLGEGCGCCH